VSAASGGDVKGEGGGDRTANHGRGQLGGGIWGNQKDPQKKIVRLCRLKGTRVKNVGEGGGDEAKKEKSSNWSWTTERTSK